MKKRKLEDVVAGAVGCAVAESLGFDGPIIGHGRDGTRYVYKREKWLIIVPGRDGTRHDMCEPATIGTGNKNSKRCV